MVIIGWIQLCKTSFTLHVSTCNPGYWLANLLIKSLQKDEQPCRLVSSFKSLITLNGPTVTMHYKYHCEWFTYEHCCESSSVLRLTFDLSRCDRQKKSFPSEINKVSYVYLLEKIEHLNKPILLNSWTGCCVWMRFTTCVCSSCEEETLHAAFSGGVCSHSSTNLDSLPLLLPLSLQSLHCSTPLIRGLPPCSLRGCIKQNMEKH